MQADKLEHYLSLWALSDPQKLAETPTSHVYTVLMDNERVVLKLLTARGKEEQSGALALRCYDGHGAVRLWRADDGAHLLEYADGEDLVALVRRGEDERAAEITADVLNQLHRAPVDSRAEGLDPLRRWFRSLFLKAEADQSAGLQSLYVKAAPIAEALLNDPREVCILHGDMHHANIRYKAGRGWLAFDPKGLIGERTFDAANTLCNPINMPELVQNEARLLTIADILARGMKIPLSRVLAYTFAYVCLSASWITKDGDNPQHELRIAHIIEPHLSL